MNESRRRLLAWAGQGMVVLALPGLAACGGGGGGDAGGGGAGGGAFGGSGAAGAGVAGTPVDAALRASTLSNIGSLVAGLAGGGASFDSAALARALQALPALERVGISSALGNVWAKFTDGQFLVVPNNLVPAAVTAASAAPALARRRALGAAETRRYAAAAGDLDTPAILTGRQYRQLDMLGQVPVNASPDAAHLCLDFVDATTLPALRRMAVGRGFTLPPIQAAEPTDVGVDNGIEGLRTVAGDGVFLINACAAQVGSDDTPRTVICSATGATEANLARYKTELDAGLLVHAVAMRGDGGVWQPLPCIAITAEFAAEHWSFPTECIGIFNLTGGARLSDWIPALNRCGLNHILGWEKGVPWPRLIAFADDLIQLNLATNNFDGRAVFQKKEPKLREYGMGESLEYLQKRGITGDGLPFYLQSNSPSLFVNTLLPTIDRAIFRENNLEFELVGQFGARADVDGVAPRIATSGSDGGSFAEPLLSRAADPPLGGNGALRDPFWQGGLLQTVLNEDDLARGGYVQVFNGGRCSNVLPITHWEIPFRVVTTIDALTLVVTVTVRLRTDVHGWRLTPDGEPRVGETVGSFDASIHSGADYAASGQISRSDADTRTTTTISWSGSGSVRNAFRNFVVNFDAFLDWNTRRSTFASLSATAGEYTQTKQVERFDINGESLGITTTSEQVPASAIAAGPGTQGLFEVAFDDRWNLRPGQFDMPDVPVDILPGQPQLVRRTRVTWPQVTPDFPPRDDYGGT